MDSSTIQSSPAPIQRQSPARDLNGEDLITYCCVCFLPVASARGNNTGGDTQFWLTSCGHIVCGSHLFLGSGSAPQNAAKTTHTCPYCSSAGISLADLGAGKVSVELRDYFRPESDLLEDVAGAIKFRMSNAMRIASHYKALAEKLQSKVDDQRRVLLKVKDELVEGKELKKQKPIMETEIINLRQEISQLRSQLSSAQLSSLGGDESQLDQQYRFSTETLQQNPISPTTTLPEINQHKRKADDIVDNSTFRAREFRKEMNKRQAMPPPALPLHMQQQHSDTGGGNQYHGQEQEQRAGMRSNEYNSHFQQLGYSPQQQQIFEDQQTSRGAPTEHDRQLVYRGGQEHQLIDLTGPTMDPPQIPSPRGGFIQKQQPHNAGQLKSDYANINIPFRSPLRAPTPMPTSSLPVRGLRDGYLTSPGHQLPGTGRYGNNIPSLHAGRDNFYPPVPQTGRLPTLQQSGNAEYSYNSGRQFQSTIPGTPRGANKGGDSVVSPFFTDPTPRTKGSGLSSIGVGIIRPVSVASFVGQQSRLSRSYGVGLRDGEFFRREDDGAGGVTVGTGTSSLRSVTGGRETGPFSGDGGVVRPGTMGAFGENRRSSVFGLQHRAGGGLGEALRNDGVTRDGIVDRPGLRRSVRRD